MNFEIIEGEPTPVPIFSRELAYVMDANKMLDVSITTAKFVKGSLMAVRSRWLVDEDTKKKKGFYQHDSQFSTDDISLGDDEKFTDSLMYGWVAHKKETPLEHEDILDTWLRRRWGT